MLYGPECWCQLVDTDFCRRTTKQWILSGSDFQLWCFVLFMRNSIYYKKHKGKQLKGTVIGCHRVGYGFSPSMLCVRVPIWQPFLHYSLSLVSINMLIMCILIMRNLLAISFWSLCTQEKGRQKESIIEYFLSLLFMGGHVTKSIERMETRSLKVLAPITCYASWIQIWIFSILLLMLYLIYQIWHVLAILVWILTQNVAYMF